ncbi:MAG: DUF2066 domain-containing protein, partial [Halofilum sp. (in: g-proteobacteria)]
MPLCSRPSTPFLAMLLLLAGGFAPLTAPAAVSADELYRAQVNVVDRRAEARRDGFQRALEQVLVKVSGSSAVRSNPDVEQLLESPERFVQQYSYQTLDAGDHEPVPAFPDDAEEAEEAEEAEDDAAEETAEPTQTLQVQFTRGRVERALEQRGLVIWGERRPELLVWLAVDDGDERDVVSSDGSSEARARFLQRARERGLPTMLPLMDMEDRSRVEFVDIQGGFLDELRRASERYRPDAMLIGHVRPRGAGWQGDWNLVGVGERKSWQGSAGAMDDAIAAGVDGATDRVARAFAGRGEEAHEYRLRVTGVDSLDAYARVSEYLASLVRVRSADVLRLQPGEIIVRISMNGRIEDLERAITLGSTLSRASDGGAVGAFGDLTVPGRGALAEEDETTDEDE